MTKIYQMHKSSFNIIKIIKPKYNIEQKIDIANTNWLLHLAYNLSNYRSEQLFRKKSTEFNTVDKHFAKNK